MNRSILKKCVRLMIPDAPSIHAKTLADALEVSPTTIKGIIRELRDEGDMIYSNCYGYCRSENPSHVLDSYWSMRKRALAANNSMLPFWKRVRALGVDMKEIDRCIDQDDYLSFLEIKKRFWS